MKKNSELQWFEMAYDAGLSEAAVNVGYILVTHSNGERVEEGMDILSEEANDGNEKAIALLNQINRKIEIERRKEEKRLQNEEAKEMLKQTFRNIGSDMWNYFRSNSHYK